MKKISIIIIIAVILAAGYFLFKGDAVSQSLRQQEDDTEQSNVSSDSNAPVAESEIKNEVTYTDSGYSPSPLTIKAGETVTFKNESSSGGMWTASGMHPSHIIYSGSSMQEHCPDTANTSFDECKSSQPGESWSFTFDKKGTWGYHNHLKATHFGKIIVE